MAKLRIEYKVVADAAALAAEAAERFTSASEKAVAQRGRARIAISGGSTPKAAFALLADPGQPWLKRVPWDKLELFWVDERCVPPDHADSNYRMTREAMLDKVPLRPEQVHRMEGELEPVVAAARYESLLRNVFRLEGAESPRFDLVALGMGPDGHTASLFPGTPALEEQSVWVRTNHVERLGMRRLTMTLPFLNSAENVIFLVAGADKAEAVRKVIEGPPGELPAQRIQPLDGSLSWFLDEAAARKLSPAARGEP